MPGAPAAFFVGNVLPDLVGLSGRTAIRKESVAGRVGDVADGIRLHLEADQRFHSDSVFIAGCQRASALLREAALSPPPRRVFFLAHVAYELALDAVLLESEPDLAADLYAKLAEGKEAALEFLGSAAPPGFSRHYDRFLEHGYLESYIHNVSLSRALRGISSRVAEGLVPDGDDALPPLMTFFATLRKSIEPEAAELLLRVGGSWYNSLQQED